MDRTAWVCAAAAALLAAIVVGGTAFLGVSTTLVIVVLIAVVCVILVGRRLGSIDSGDLGVGFVGLAVATSPWNAVSIGPIKPAPVALGVGVVLLLIDAAAYRRPIRVPGWVWVLSAAIVVICLATLVWPVSVGYIGGRYTGGLAPMTPEFTSPGDAGATAGVKWLVAALALPVAVCLVGARRPDRIPSLAIAWMVGATVSAAVAVTDELGLTRISAGLPSISFATRQAGLSVHANHMSLCVAMAIPVLIWVLVRSRGIVRCSVVLAALLMAGGLIVSGSRAGIGGAALATLVALLLEKRTRVHLPLLLTGLAAVGLLVVAVRPTLVSSVAQHLRFVDNSSATDSDSIRAGLGQQALEDFLHSPLHGIGFGVLSEGHDIYLQVIACGGIVLLLGFGMAQAGCLREAWRVDDGDSGLGRALGAAAATFLVAGVVSNQLADLFVYVPFALVAGLWAAHHAAPASRPTPSADGVRHHPTPAREELPA